MSSGPWRFDWDGIRGELQPLGGMLGPLTFDLPSGRPVQPLVVAPWGDDPAERLATLPPILQRLRGEWPCVPFGMPDTRLDLPVRWMAGVDTATPADDAFVHGYGSNHEWSLVERGARHIDIGIDYPRAHPVRRLTRRVRPIDSGTLELTLGIEMRRDARLPIGLHPVFALPARAGSATLSIESATAVHTFPVEVEPGVSVLQPDAGSPCLSTVPGRHGATHDLTSLPLPQATEELVLVALEKGRVTLHERTAGYRTALGWDIDVFPQCLLWLSNGGRSAYPWNGRFRALGIEPVAASFDLGQRHGEHAHSPLASMVRATTASLSSARPLRTAYRISVEQAPVS